MNNVKWSRVDQEPITTESHILVESNDGQHGLVKVIRENGTVKFGTDVLEKQFDQELEIDLFVAIETNFDWDI